MSVLHTSLLERANELIGGMLDYEEITPSQASELTKSVNDGLLSMSGNELCKSIEVHKGLDFGVISDVRSLMTDGGALTTQALESRKKYHVDLTKSMIMEKGWRPWAQSQILDGEEKAFMLADFYVAEYGYSMEEALDLAERTFAALVA